MPPTPSTQGRHGPRTPNRSARHSRHRSTPRSQISGSGHHRRHAPVSVALVNATVPAGRVDGSLHPCPHDRGVHISSARVPSPIRPMLTDSIAARQQCFSWSRTRSHSLRKRFRNNGLIVTNRWRLAPALPSPTEMRTDSRVPERRRQIVPQRGGTVNLSSPRAIFAGSPPRFTRSRVTYEAYVVSRTSTRPQVDSAAPTANAAATTRTLRRAIADPPLNRCLVDQA